MVVRNSLAYPSPVRRMEGKCRAAASCARLANTDQEGATASSVENCGWVLHPAVTCRGLSGLSEATYQAFLGSIWPLPRAHVHAERLYSQYQRPSLVCRDPKSMSQRTNASPGRVLLCVNTPFSQTQTPISPLHIPPKQR